MKNRKSIIALLLVAIIGVVALTFAYFTNTATIENEFKTNSYGTTVVEEFVSPDNWTPGTTTDKTLVVTNSGNIDEAVRVKYTESWTSKNGNPLPLKKYGIDAAIINWANPDDWTKVTENNKNYYYYNYKLAPASSTSTLLNSVTFNPSITNDSDCTTTEGNGVKTITCNSTGDGYDGATYTLTFTIETVQYDKYKDAWRTNFEVAAEKLTASQYLVNNATNPANTEYNNDTKGKMFTFTHPQTEQTPAQTDYRYIGDEPNNYIYFNCDEPQAGVEYNYATSCEVWRILGVFDVDDGTGNVEQRMKLVRGNEFTNVMTYNPRFNNDWTISPLNTFLNSDYYNRTGDATTYGLKESARDLIDDAVYYLGAISYNSVFGTTEKIYGEERGNTFCKACHSEDKLAWTGKVGLMYPSDEYMVYGNGVNATCYDNTDGCNGTNAQTGWVFNSNIREGQSSKEYTWLISSSFDTPGSMLNAHSDGNLIQEVSVYNHGVRPVVYLKSNAKIVSGTGESGNPYTLRDYISNNPSTEPLYPIGTTIIGTTINYNNENYCVIKNSIPSDDYLTLIKQEPLNYDELVTYNNGYEIGRYNGDNNVGIISYFKSDNCYFNGENSNNDFSGCSTNYNNSFVKNIITNWSNSMNNDLKEVDGYKARLLNIDELFENLGYDRNIRGTTYEYLKTENVPRCLDLNYDYWTMSPIEDSNMNMYIINAYGRIDGYMYLNQAYNGRSVFKQYAVRPVINLKKCALDGTC